MARGEACAELLEACAGERAQGNTLPGEAKVFAREGLAADRPQGSEAALEVLPTRPGGEAQPQAFLGASSTGLPSESRTLWIA